MKIAIVGWGVEGQSAYRFFGPRHSYLIVNEEPRDDFPAESPTVEIQFLPAQKPVGITSNAKDLSYLDGIEDCDKIIYSPTSYKNLERKFGDNVDFWQKTTSERHIFFETVNTKNIIGITGTKGKGTTSTLITKMLEADGKKVFLGGNIGKSVLDFVREVQPDDWVVLELSNFQLYHFHHSPHIAVCLMIVPEHLDWHKDMQDYVEAKSNLFQFQTSEDIAIYFAKNKYSTEVANYSPGTKIPYYETPGARVREDGIIVIGENTEVINKDEVKLLGEHNLQNVCAAITTVWQITQNVEAIRKVLTTFSGLEHRLEFVREFNGVKYYDDSFGTTPETAIVALQSFNQPKVLIAGGSDKGTSYESLADAIVNSNARHVITVGVTGPKIAELLRQRNFSNITEGLTTMTDIINEAHKHAQPEDVVLLSTGSASFGLFLDYKDRGNQFKAAVQALA
jgi:UDP-N-acetylmuramoylalanine--D-glutamate ligase